MGGAEVGWYPRVGAAEEVEEEEEVDGGEGSAAAGASDVVGLFPRLRKIPTGLSTLVRVVGVVGRGGGLPGAV